MSGWLSRWPALAGELVLSLFSEPCCAGCDAPVALGAAALCAPCAATLIPGTARAPPGIGRVRALGAYGGALAEAIRRFKYGDRPDLARPLGRLLRQALEDSDWPRPDRLVPVPLHSRRLAARRYNQAALLAPHAAPGVRIDTRALRRARDTPPQAELERRSRLDNVKDAFVADPRRVAGQAIWLLDDVTTTGATLAACAAALTQAGAARVDAIVLATPVD